MLKHAIYAALALTASVAVTPATAQVFKVGVCVALVGNNANIDRAWRDGVDLAAQTLNASGGILSNKIELLVEDNRSEPQEAAAGYRKLIDDGAQILLSGSVSAGNAAGAPMAVKAEIPILAPSVFPQKEDITRWTFSTLASPRFDAQARLAVLRDTVKADQIGIITDPAPYSNLLKNLLIEEAPKFGIKIVGEEQYKQTDADLSVAITKLHAQGAKAIVKFGVGPSTLTAAKNMRQLALGIPLMNMESDFEVAKASGQTLGKDFIVGVYPMTAFDSLPEGHPYRKSLQQFITLWRAKYGDRDPTWATFGWDAMMITAFAAKQANSTNGGKIRDVIDNLKDYPGAAGVYTFSPTVRMGISKNPFLMGRFVSADGKIEFLN